VTILYLNNKIVRYRSPKINSKIGGIMFWSIWLRAVGRWNEFESGGHRSYAKRRTISRFGERFRDGQYSLVSFLFAVLLLTVPLCPAFV